jgi:hypothetical protein
MNSPQRITLPDKRPSTYPCESINRVVCEDTIPSLTAAERRSAYAEMGQALYAVQSEIDLARKRSVLPPDNLSFRTIDFKWLGKARRLVTGLSELLFVIRQYERDLAPRAIEVDAERKRRSVERRTRRQQNYIDAFTCAVLVEVGEEKMSEMLRSAGLQADRWTKEDEKREPGPVRQRMEY